jgi:hypothetical protein
MSGAEAISPHGVIAAESPIINAGRALPLQDEAEERVAQPLRDGKDGHGRNHA